MADDSQAEAPGGKQGLLERLGRFCARRHWWVIGAWVLIAIAVAAGAKDFGTDTSNDFSIPGTDSQAALDILETEFPAAAGASATVVYQAPDGKEIAEFDDAINKTVAELGKIDDVVLVGDPTKQPSLVSTSHAIAYSPVQFDKAATEIPADSFKDLEAAVEGARKAGLDVQLGGGVVDAQNPPKSPISNDAEAIGLLFAFVILLIAFGSVLHMALPLGNAIFGIAVLGSAVVLLEHEFAIAETAPTLGTMLALGVGIDYALFIVTRHRAGLESGMTVVDAAGHAHNTSGRAVLFAGITVCISTAALTLVGIPIVGTMGLITAFFVAVMVLISLTLLPAMLGLSGHKLTKWRIPGLGPKEQPDADHPRGFARLAHAVADHPWRYGGMALVFLLVLAAPFVKMRIGFTDDGEAPENSTQRKAYDLMAEGFSPGQNGPLLVVIETEPDKDESATVTKLVEDLKKESGVSEVEGPTPAASKKADLLIVIPETGPADAATSDLVRHMRDDVIPDAVSGSSISAADVHVGGPTATFIDLTDRVSERLPWFIGAVLLTSFVLLTMVFRSLLVPLKAVIMNVLSIGAAYGIVVAVFQWGWMRDVVGLEQPIAIWSFVPLMMFSILFGLSMDYEVFLMSRVREEYLKSGSPRQSVVAGVSTTARVITSAALVMMSVFLSFVSNPAPVVKMIGLGLAAAVLVDATIVRLVLVPAVMEIIGTRAWWLPRWLDRILPNISLD